MTHDLLDAGTRDVRLPALLPFAQAPDFHQQYALQLLEAGGRVVQHCEDVLAILCVKCGGRPSADRRFQKRLGSVLRTVALQPLRELNDEVVGQGNPSKPHTLDGSRRNEHRPDQRAPATFVSCRTPSVRTNWCAELLPGGQAAATRFAQVLRVLSQ